MTEVRKAGYTVQVSEHQLASMSGFEHKGHTVEIPLTAADRDAHARAKAALAEIESNPWITWGYEGPELDPLEARGEFVAEETTEEWLQRWREAGSPMQPAFDLAQHLSFAFNDALDQAAAVGSVVPEKDPPRSP